MKIVGGITCPSFVSQSYVKIIKPQEKIKHICFGKP